MGRNQGWASPARPSPARLAAASAISQQGKAGAGALLVIVVAAASSCKMVHKVTAGRNSC